MFLRQSTAFTFRLGPFIDESDFKTAATSLSIAYTTVRLSKAGAAFASKNDTTAPTHDSNGWYVIALNTTDTNTVGTLDVAIHQNGALPVFTRFYVLPQNVYDRWFASTADAGTLLGNVPSNVLAAAIEGSFTLQQVMRLIAAATAGKLSGAGTTSITIRNLGDTLNRITATVDEDGNRITVTYNLS